MTKDEVFKTLRQYPVWQQDLKTKQAELIDLQTERAAKIDGISSVVLSDLPRGTDLSDPTYYQTLKLVRYDKVIHYVKEQIKILQGLIRTVDDMLAHLSAVEAEVLKARCMRIRPESYRALSWRLHYVEESLRNVYLRAIKKMMTFDDILSDNILA